MRRQVHLDNMGRVYREFSRQRYNKYRSQFPKLREADIVVRILREWDRMNSEEKQHLSSEYVRKNYIKEEQEGSNSHPTSTFKTPTKSDTFRSILLGTDKSKFAPSTAKTDEHLKRFLQNEEEIPFYHDYVDEPHESRSSYSVNVQNSSLGSGKLSSNKKHEYISFYKFYFKRYSQDHPRWGAAKITTLIRLLWKSRVSSRKSLKAKQAKEAKMKVKTIRKTSGYLFFKKLKLKQNHSTPETKNLWKRLPLEAKIMWKQEGEMETTRPRPYRCSTVRFGSMNSLLLDFMHKIIQQ